MEQIATKSHVRLVITHIAKDGRQDVGLLSDALMDAGLQFSAWVIEDKGGAELIDAASVFDDELAEAYLEG
jgi:hypothetical protein